MKSLSELLSMDKTLLLYLLNEHFNLILPANTPFYDLINIYRDSEIEKLIHAKREKGILCY